MTHAYEVDSRCRHMLEGGFRLSDIPGSSQPVGAAPWGKRPLHTRTAGMLGCILQGACACCLEREMVILSTHSERPPGSARALHTTGTWLAVLPGELDLDHLIGAVIYRWRPTQAGTPPRAGGLLLYPINMEAAGVEALCRLRLPFVIGARWAAQIHPILALTCAQEFGVSGARVSTMCRSGNQSLPASA